MYQVTRHIKMGWCFNDHTVSYLFLHPVRQSWTSNKVRHSV